MLSGSVILVLLYVCHISVVASVLVELLLFFFFFKQKTAYEMRISDWSSDVCSSDLSSSARADSSPGHPPSSSIAASAGSRSSSSDRNGACARARPTASTIAGDAFMPHSALIWPIRSEEHTSELQSLMRISYAVFCLNTKTTNKIQIRPIQFIKIH